MSLLIASKVRGRIIFGETTRRAIEMKRTKVKMEESEDWNERKDGSLISRIEMFANGGIFHEKVLLLVKQTSILRLQVPSAASLLSIHGVVFRRLCVLYPCHS